MSLHKTGTCDIPEMASPPRQTNTAMPRISQTDDVNSAPIVKTSELGSEERLHYHVACTMPIYKYGFKTLPKAPNKWMLNCQYQSSILFVFENFNSAIFLKNGAILRQNPSG